MRVPESITDRLPALAVLENDWEPVSPVALAGWVLFYGIVLLGAASGGGVARWFDLVFVPIHEGGHLLFGWFGSHWLTVAGGTLLQLFVPFALAVYFALQRQLPGTAFSTFFFFEQLLPVGIYMADSRSQSLTYVTVGDPDQAEHDWYYLFSHAGVLDHDTQIGGAVRVLGFIGMLGVVAWLIWRAWPKRNVRRDDIRPSGAIMPVFGDLGRNLDEASKSGFWQWFHLEQTGEKNGMRRFQPSGPQFDSLCYVDVEVSAKNELKSLTMGVQRAVIEGAEQPFARDLVRSFLCAVFPQKRSEAVGQLLDELGSELGGSQPVIVADGANRAAKPKESPSPQYLVFLGPGKRCAMRSGTFLLEAENVNDGITRWLCVRVRPSLS
jgi:hypothetical protein